MSYAVPQERPSRADRSRPPPERGRPGRRARRSDAQGRGVLARVAESRESAGQVTRPRTRDGLARLRPRAVRSRRACRGCPSSRGMARSRLPPYAPNRQCQTRAGLPKNGLPHRKPRAFPAHRRMRTIVLTPARMTLGTLREIWSDGPTLAVDPAAKPGVEAAAATVAQVLAQRRDGLRRQHRLRPARAHAHRRRAPGRAAARARALAQRGHGRAARRRDRPARHRAQGRVACARILGRALRR